MVLCLLLACALNIKLEVASDRLLNTIRTLIWIKAADILSVVTKACLYSREPTSLHTREERIWERNYAETTLVGIVLFTFGA